MQDTTLASIRPQSHGVGRDRVGARAAAYCALAAGLLLLFLAARETGWTASPAIPAMLELSAAIVALVVGTLALVRYYTRKNDTLLLIGAGMLGTAALDAYQFLVIGGGLGWLPAGHASGPWSWFGSRMFLSLLLCWSWTTWRRERREDHAALSELRIYLEVSALTILAIALFGLVDLPAAVALDRPVPRPFEFLPGAFFATAVAGYLSKGNWRTRPFEVWLVPSLIVAVAIQWLFMPYSAAGVDAWAVASHALKLLSYVFIFIGLVASMHGLYRQVERSHLLIEHSNTALRSEIEYRRAAEKEARDSGEKYRTILATIQEGYFEVDLAGNFVFWNDSLADLLGYPGDRLLGLNYRAYTREARATDVFETLSEIYRTGEPVDAFGWELVRADGSRRYAEASAGPVRDGDGEIVGFRGIVRDVTARRTAEERLESKSRELVRSNEELRQFAYVASHDLQEPLRMIAGYTQLLARRYKGQLDDEADLFIKYCVEGVTRMQRLIRDLLDYSRVQTHGSRFEPLALDLAVEWARSNVESTLDEAEAGVTIDTLPVVEADATQMGQLFQNLFTNAIKFRGEQALRIHVGVRKRPGEWQVFVRDNGIGVDPEHRTRIFEIFQRLHTRQAYEGTGIGLAICKRIVERHGGRIWVEPSPEGGATFVFTLPRLPTERTDRAPERATAAFEAADGAGGDDAPSRAPSDTSGDVSGAAVEKVHVEASNDEPVAPEPDAGLASAGHAPGRFRGGGGAG